MELGPIKSALNGALRFLGDSVCGFGGWEEFESNVGKSGPWCSAFIFAQIGSLPEAPILAGQVSDLLHRVVRHGWGFNERVPDDCDSTAWSLLALANAGFVRPSVVLRSSRFILGHQDPESGGFRTYHTDLMAKAHSARREWFLPSPCVTAAAILALLTWGEDAQSHAVVRATSYLRAQESNGGWQGYWWIGRTYTTFHVLLALHRAGCMDPEILRSVLGSILKTQKADGSFLVSETALGTTFETAWGLSILLLGPSEDPAYGLAVRSAVQWLLDRQLADGSFATSPSLRIRNDEIGSDRVLADEGRTFTTATVARALHRYWLVSC